MKLRRFAQLIDDLEGGGFLTRDPIGIDRIHDREIIPLAQQP